MPLFVGMQDPAGRIGDEQFLGRVFECDTLAASPGSVTSVAFQVEKNQSSAFAYWRWMRPTVWRKLTASRIDSVVNATPLAPSIIAAEISFEAMIG